MSQQYQIIRVFEYRVLQMGKKTKKSQKQSSQGQYRLELNGSSSCYYNQKSKWNYPPFQSKATLPRYNNDRLPYTPAFICPAKERDDETYKQKYLKKWHEYQAEKSDIVHLIPRPRSKNQYCSVCKKTYTDYLKHVTHNKHLRTIQNSLHQHWIQEECRNTFGPTLDDESALSKENRTHTTIDQHTLSNENTTLSKQNTTLTNIEHTHKQLIV